MTNRERTKNTLLGREKDRAAAFQNLDVWEETRERWLREGLKPGEDWNAAAGFDPDIKNITDFSRPDSIKVTLYPFFEYEVLETKPASIVTRDQFGIVKQERTDGTSMPLYLEHPVKDVEDWKRLKEERFDPDLPSRFPDNFDELAEQYNRSDLFIQIGAYPMGLFGTCRDLLGTMEVLESFYTQPELIADMMDHLTDFWIRIYEKIVQKVHVDGVHIWEDMSGTTGSLISPEMVRTFLSPNYRKIRDFCDKNGIEILSLDTDGDVSQLIEPFMEAGINVLLPMETVPQYTLLDIRKKYPTLGIIGGIDKKEIAKGKDAIDAELLKTKEMLQYGYYVPALDHAAHPAISWQDFQYYAHELMKIV